MLAVGSFSAFVHTSGHQDTTGDNQTDRAHEKRGREGEREGVRAGEGGREGQGCAPGRAAAGPEEDGAQSEGLHAREDGSYTLGGEEKHVPRERERGGEGERGRGGEGGRGRGGEGADAPPECHAARSGIATAQREEAEWDFGPYGNFVKAMLPKVRDAEPVTGKGMYAMSHHHTYYVTSSYILCQGP